MANNIADLVNELKQEQVTIDSTYTAIVSHTDNEGNVWVYLAGSDSATPTASSSSEVKAGDTVTVEWRNNKLYIAGNNSNPSAGVASVQNVEIMAQIANQAAQNAVADAGVAREAAEDAKATAESVHGIAVQAQADANIAKESASNASEYAARALGNLSTVQSVTETLNWITSHGTMTASSDYIASSDTEVEEGKKYYSRSGSGTSEDPYVYTLISNPTGNPSTSGYYEGKLDPTHVYFVLNDPPTGQTEPHGDYEVGGHYYDVVTEPDVADISTYYELSIDESLNNYVGTHLAVTSEGLWLLPDAGGNKVLIATGQGSTYSTAGTYIIGKVNNVDTVLASFTSSGAQIGQTGESYLVMDADSMQLIDKEKGVFFYAGDLRDGATTALLTEYFVGDGATQRFNLLTIPSNVISVTVDNVEVTNYSVYQNSQIYFTTAPRANSSIIVSYHTSSAGTDNHYGAYTFGVRRSGHTVAPGSVAEGNKVAASNWYAHAEGNYTVASGIYSHAEGDSTAASGDYGSHAEGEDTTASGRASHAEGSDTTASGGYSHAEGRNATASGRFAHAQNYSTIAQRKSQTTLGEYNIADTGGTDETTRGDYAVIIGNGTSDSARSNALTVAWTGDVAASGDIADGSGNVLSDKADTSIVPTMSAILDMFYPVGSYYETSDNTFNPNTTWGGTWYQEIEGQVHVSAGSNYTVSGADTTSTVGSETRVGTNRGGAESKTVPTTKLDDAHIAHGHGFTQPSIPNHSHSMSHNHPSPNDYFVTTNATSIGRRTIKNGTGTEYTNNVYAQNALVRSANTGAASASNTGTTPSATACSGGAVSNLSGASSTRTAHGHGSIDVRQPFINVYRWHRVA